MRNLHDILRPVAAQAIDALLHLQPVPDRATERLIHPCDIRDGPLPERLADLNQCVRKCFRVVERGHKRAGPGFYVQHERIDPLGEFLAHNARSDQRDALDRRGHIPKCIQSFVRRGDLLGLPYHHHLLPAQNLPVAIQRNIYLKPRNRLQFV